MTVGPPEPAPHIAAIFIALALASIAVAAVLLYCNRLEREYVHALAPDLSETKLQGAVLQQQAFSQPDLLVLYGSSELVNEMPNKATEFFADYPTGFRVFAVGKPGAASLAMLQKIAAVGPAISKRKVAYSISPGYFFQEVFDPKYYEGNFSVLQASELAFSGHLSRELKRDVAHRMLAFPKTLDDEWLLETALELLAADQPADRVLYPLLRPLGLMNNAIGRAQDHVEAGLHILAEDEKLNARPKRVLRALNWGQFLKTGAKSNAAVVQEKRTQAKRLRPKSMRDKPFLASIAKAKEWTDFELLLRTFKELHAQPLLLSMPVEDIRLEAGGLSPVARNAYSERLDALARSYDFPLVAFREHEKDPGFLVDFFDHLSSKGWLFYDKALDDFFHDRFEKYRLGEKVAPPGPMKSSGAEAVPR